MNKLIKKSFERMQKGALVILCVAMLAVSFISCTKREESSSQGIYYVVGFDGSAEVDVQKGTAKSGGYLFISENLKDSLLVNNRFVVPEGEEWHSGYRIGDLLDGIVDIPIEAFIGGCGFTLFPEEYRFAFKVQINSYRPMTEEEILETARFINAMCSNPLWFSGQRFKSSVITSISKIQ